MLALSDHFHVAYGWQVRLQIGLCDAGTLDSRPDQHYGAVTVQGICGNRTEDRVQGQALEVAAEIHRAEEP